jgi:hypothetical protein
VGDRLQVGTVIAFRSESRSASDRNRDRLAFGTLIGFARNTQFRLAAHSLHHNKSRLGDFLRKMKAKLGPKAATTATAHKIATIFYTLVTRQIEYDDSIWVARDEENRKRMENKLKRQAASLGFNLIPKEVPQ